MKKRIDFPANRPLVAGIVNATGDSFSEGSASVPESALDRALQLIDDGVDLLDIGGESTRPGAREVPPEEECRRILPVIGEVLRLRPGTVVSVDTRNSVTAQAALEAGAAIVNDVSMLRHDPELKMVVARCEAMLVISHSRGTPLNMTDPVWHDYGADPVATVAAELEQAAAEARAAGVAESDIWLDPGFGFAKSAAQNWEIMRRIGELSGRYPLFVGVSRKSFFGSLLGRENPRERAAGTLAAELFLADAGVAVIRTHDVRALRDALRVREELAGGPGGKA